MSDAFSSAFSLLKATPYKKKVLADMQAGKREHAQRRMQTGPTEDPDDEFDYDTEDGSKKPIGEDEDTGYDMRTTEERRRESDDPFHHDVLDEVGKSAFDLAMKALNPAQQDDPTGPLSERRHDRNIGRQMRIYDSGKDFGAIGSGNKDHPSQLPDLRMPPSPQPQSSGQRNSNTTGTFPPNPPPQHPMAGSPNTQEMPRNIEQQARPLSESNPYGRIKESELQRLADEFGIPFAKAWTMLKALPEQQMFVERTRRENAGGSDDYEEHYGNPEIDRFGARSMGTVHPAILGMLQRRTDDYHQSRDIPPNLNLDAGREEDRTMHPEVLRYQPERSERAGMSIAAGPEFNRRMYDANDQTPSEGSFYGNMNSEDIYHNPDRAARGGPFDDSRHASGHNKPERFMTGYGFSPSHKLTHPKAGEYD